MTRVRGIVGPFAVVPPAALPSDAGNTVLSRASSNPIHLVLGSKRAHALRAGFETRSSLYGHSKTF